MQTVTSSHRPLEDLIAGWLFEKQTSESGSQKTDLAYRTTLQSFRQALQRGGLDLDSEDVYTLANVATLWAGLRAPTAKRTWRVSASTYNQRLAILSSFYTYVEEQARLYSGVEGMNPMKNVKRRN